MRRGGTARAAVAMLVGGALIAVGAGCGSTDPGVTPNAARTLHGGVQIVRAAAAIGDRDAVASAVAHLEQVLAGLRADGRISADADARIRRAIAAVRADVRLIPTTTTTTTTTTRPEHGKRDEKGKGHDKHDD